MQDVLLLWRKITRGRGKENGAKRRNPASRRPRMERSDVILPHGGQGWSNATQSCLREAKDGAKRRNPVRAHWSFPATTVHSHPAQTSVY